MQKTGTSGTDRNNRRTIRKKRKASCILRVVEINTPVPLRRKAAPFFQPSRDCIILRQLAVTNVGYVMQMLHFETADLTT